MNKTFEPKEFEIRLYKWWEESGFFKPDEDPEKPTYTIVMPPPNITGQLHLGHAMDNSIPDCLIRMKRMQGYSVLWLPGTDHASIATEVKIVEKMKQEGLSKEKVGREGFLKLAWDWKKQYGGRIIEQLRRLGSSCDWSREAFTMDENLSRAVRHVFVKMYNDGLIYRGSRIINRCIKCGTAISDAEVEYVSQASHLWHFKYYTKDGKESIQFATTRPETMLGDTAIAVNPDDERYKDMIGKTVIVPFVMREIPIVADQYVEKDFGSGAVKITPAHDPNDFEVGLRHNLPLIKIMDDNAVINEVGGEMFCGLDRFEARKKIVAEMEKLGQLVKIEDYTHNVGECHRCHTTVEPMVSKQWFVRMKPLAGPAIDAVKNGDIRFVPKYFEKTYFHWMENIRDWCISRQLWWGHRIPVYYCEDCGEEICLEEEPKCCPKCGSERLHQDEDVLDTWFSSALWPYSTMGYPDETEDLRRFFPTDVLVTGYDIIPFWVSRMIFSSLRDMHEVPFRDVIIHGLVRDSEGRKMSKSLGNGIDPLEIIDNYGADVLRFSLLNGVSNGTDLRFSTDKIQTNRNFMNKVWNASRFVLMNAEGRELKDIFEVRLSLADKWILHSLNGTIKEVTENIGNYDIGLASQKLYDFIWSTFCDWYIEFSKPVLYGTDEESRTTTISVLVYVLDKILKILHPLAPFITEEIYQSTPNHGKTIMLEKYPEFSEKLVFDAEAELMEEVREMITKVRNARAEMNVVPSRRIRLFVKPSIAADALESVRVYVEKLAGLEYMEITDKTEDKDSVSIVCKAGELHIPMGDLVDKDKEIARLSKELETVTSEIKRAEGKLNNPGFVQKAPEKLIFEEKKKLESYKDLKARLDARLESLKSR